MTTVNRPRTMRPEDVPAALVDAAMTGAAPGCRSDARFYLANALPVFEEMLLADLDRRAGKRQTVARGKAIEQLLDEQLARIEAAVRAKVATELRAWAKAITDSRGEVDDPLAEHIWTTCARSEDAPAVWDDPRTIAQAAYEHLAARVERRGLLAELTREAVNAGSYGEPAPHSREDINDRAAALLASGQIPPAPDPAQARMDDRREEAIARFVEVVTTQSGALIEPSGCQHCGIGEREHGQRWWGPPKHPAGPGWHRWTEPTQEQRKARMRARRTRREQAR